MSAKIKYQTLAEAPDEYILAYYEHQYGRMEKLEGQNLTVTNIVITLSVLAFSFGLGNADEVIGVLVGLALLVVMGFTNLFAIAYIIANKSWKNTHQKRAKEIMKARVFGLYEFNETTKASHKEWLPGRTQFQLSFSSFTYLD